MSSLFWGMSSRPIPKGPPSRISRQKLHECDELVVRIWVWSVGRGYRYIGMENRPRLRSGIAMRWSGLVVTAHATELCCSRRPFTDGNSADKSSKICI
jgi:hypothetical protein